MQTPTFAIAVTFEIKPECVELFRRRIQQQAKDSITQEPGCCQFDVLIDEADPNIVFLYESYVDAQAFDYHKQTPHFADYDRTVGPWIVTKQVRRLLMLQANHR